MSALVALHCGRFAIVGTDTRVTAYDVETVTKVRKVQDVRGKVYCDGHRLFSGTGNYQLLLAVISRLSQAATAQVALDVIAEEQEKYYQRRPPQHREMRRLQAWWLITFRSGEGVHVLVYDPMHGHEFHEMPANSGICNIARDQTDASTEGHQSQVGAYVTDRRRVCAADEPIGPSIQYHIDVVRRALALAADQSRTISRDSVIGIHTDTGVIRTRTYPPIRPDEGVGATRAAATMPHFNRG